MVAIVVVGEPAILLCICNVLVYLLMIVMVAQCSVTCQATNRWHARVTSVWYLLWTLLLPWHSSQQACYGHSAITQYDGQYYWCKVFLWICCALSCDVKPLVWFQREADQGSNLTVTANVGSRTGIKSRSQSQHRFTGSFWCSGGRWYHLRE